MPHSIQDPEEHIDLAIKYPDRLQSMKARLAELTPSFYNNNDSFPLACPDSIQVRTHVVELELK